MVSRPSGSSRCIASVVWLASPPGAKLPLQAIPPCQFSLHKRASLSSWVKMLRPAGSLLAATTESSGSLARRSTWGFIWGSSGALSGVVFCVRIVCYAAHLPSFGVISFVFAGLWFADSGGDPSPLFPPCSLHSEHHSHPSLTSTFFGSRCSSRCRAHVRTSLRLAPSLEADAALPCGRYPVQPFLLDSAHLLSPSPSHFLRHLFVLPTYLLLPQDGDFTYLM
ncbi:hypothetical protein GGX14DRAFT_578770 [Mycena pura]|uniref:Uncharacterized protein n=1 Tax=Mycena pura TaxID=153505 RepID=A0AAD6XXG6_9AGAR|nr:hypothetical protein GGX14DRAFT_578770 [Mycena pura]